VCGRVSLVLTLHRRAHDPVRRGHPWVFREAILRAQGEATTGAAATLVDDTGRTLGYGVYDASSPLAVRVWGPTPVDEALVASRLRAAFDLRRALFRDGRTTAYRLLHGEGDRTPGLVLDRYGEVAVLRTDGDAAAVLADRHAATLRDELLGTGVTTLVSRQSARSRRAEAPRTEVLFGDPPPARVAVTEHGVPFEVDLAEGQKTGAFLDQRENRARVGQLAASLRRRGAPPVRVLNLFSYAGGFSLHAALEGAHTTSVDVAPLAHKTAQASFKAAGVGLSGHAFVAADVYAYLADAKKKGLSWDIVISDPPSFAPSEKAVARALSAYRTLHGAAAAVLRPGGVFCAASCSSHIGLEAFLGTLDDDALGRADLRMVDAFGPPADHPSLPAFPEGRYLKLAVLR